MQCRGGRVRAEPRQEDAGGGRRKEVWDAGDGEGRRCGAALEDDVLEGAWRKRRGGETQRCGNEREERVAAGGRLLYYSAPELPKRRTDWDLCLLWHAAGLLGPRWAVGGAQSQPCPSPRQGCEGDGQAGYDRAGRAVQGRAGQAGQGTG